MKKQFLALALSGLFAASASMAAYAGHESDFYSEASDKYNAERGETLAEFQSSEFPYVDRRYIRVSQGAGDLHLEELARLAHHDRLALHFVNDTNGAVQINIPELQMSFMIPAGQTRVQEFASSAIGYHSSVDYSITSLVARDAGGIAQNAELMRIINSRIVIPTFADDEPTRRTARRAPRKTMVRGYW